MWVHKQTNIKRNSVNINVPKGHVQQNEGHNLQEDKYVLSVHTHHTQACARAHTHTHTQVYLHTQ